MSVPEIIKLDPRDPDHIQLKRVVDACREGKVVGFPTETVYGIGGLMSVPGIETCLQEIKGRGERKPFAFHIGDWDMIDKLGVVQTPEVRFLMRSFWPGPVTLIVKNTTGETIGVRFPRNKVARFLIRESGEPFIATSANQSGLLSPHTAHQVVEQLGNKIEFLIDTGRTEFSHDSTVLDVSGEVPVVLRKSAYGAEVEKAVARIKTGQYPKKKILVVCTGNSCRSPMAEGWLKKELERKGLSDEIEVASCGIGARDGLPAASEAEYVMKNRGVDLGCFKSRQCRDSDIWGADVILVMAGHHADSLEELMPGSRAKTHCLDVEDPIGLGMMVYEKTMDQIERKIRDIFYKIV